MKTHAKTLAHRRKTLFPPRMILAPLDFSECSDAGLAAARLLAQRFACRLELAHVDEGPPPAMSQTAMEAVARRGLEAYEQGLRSKLEAARAGLEHVGTHLVSGSADTVLPRLAQDAAADLLVMGTHGRTGLGRLALSSVAEGDGLTEVPHDELQDHVERLLEHGDPEPQWLWRKGRPYEEIVNAAEDEGFDLIVISAQPRGRLQEALIGTTAERVIRCSRVPVLAVPSRAGG